MAATGTSPTGPLLVEATYSGGVEGTRLRVVSGTDERTFDAKQVAVHPALSAVLRLIADEVDLSVPRRRLGLVPPQPPETKAHRQGEALPRGEPASSHTELLPMLFLSLLTYVERVQTPVPRPHWGRPIRHRQIEKAVELLNANLQGRWSVASLARAVGLSRPAFARQFLATLGLSPMRYLKEQRMLAASALLRSSDASLAEVASHVGYQSEFAFSRAFKRHYQVAPGAYRKRMSPVASAVRMAA